MDELTPIHVDLVINAGGMSRRMGRNKALLPVPPQGTPLVVHIFRRLRPMTTGRVVVVTQDAAVAAAVRAEGDDAVDVVVVADLWEGGGALGGIATGLAQCTGWAMVVACDMPFASPAIFAALCASAATSGQAAAVIPRIGGQAQPFHGVWHVRALPVLTTQLRAGRLAIHDALGKLGVVWMDEAALGVRSDDPAFLNVNTREEWEAIRRRFVDLKGQVP